MGPEALGGGGRPRGARLQRTQCGEHTRDLREILGRETAEGLGIERAEVLVESVDHQPKGQLALELGSAAAQREAASLLGPPGQLLQQRGLADAGLASDEGHARRARHRFVEQPLGELLLVLSAHQGRF